MAPLRGLPSAHPPAAPTLVRPPGGKEGAAGAGPSSSPAPRKKKTVKKTKKKVGTYESGVGNSKEEERPGFDNETWMDEQQKLTEMMNHMYSKNFEAGGSSSDDEDHLAYYDYEAEERYTQEYSTVIG